MAHGALGRGPLANLCLKLARRVAVAAPAQHAAWAAPPPALAAPHWVEPIRSVAQTFPAPQPLEVVGAPLPPEIEGTLFRNGPGLLESPGGAPYRCLLDADGLACAIELGPTPTFTSRLVDTAARRAEERVGRRLYGGMGHGVPGWLLGHLRGRGVKNVANTNLVHFDGALLALYECGGAPHRLDPVTLETLGTYDLDGRLGAGARLSAHPKLADDGSLVTFGLSYPALGSCLPEHAASLRHGPAARADIYQKYPGRPARRVAQVALPFATPVHDCALVREADGSQSLALVCSPALVTWGGARELMLGRGAPLAGLQWRPEAGTEVRVVSLAGGPTEAYRLRAAGLAQHIVGARRAEGALVIDVCAFRDLSCLDVMGPVAESTAERQQRAALLRLTLHADGRSAVRDLSRTPLEFPCVDPRRPHDDVYGLTWAATPMPSVPARVRLSDGMATQVRLPAGHCAGAPSLVPKRDGPGVWLLTIVTDARSGAAALHVYDGERLTQQPRCRLPLPERRPWPQVDFHTTWVPRVAGRLHDAM